MLVHGGGAAQGGKRVEVERNGPGWVQCVLTPGGVVQRAVHITAGQFRRDPGQRVGRSRHGRKYDHFGLFVADKSCDVFDSFDGAYRGAPEFQDFYFPLLVIHWFVFLFAIWFAVPIGQLECRFPVS